MTGSPSLSKVRLPFGPHPAASQVSEERALVVRRVGAHASPLADHPWVSPGAPVCACQLHGSGLPAATLSPGRPRTWEKVCDWICSNSSRRLHFERFEWNRDMAVTLLHSARTLLRAVMTSGRVRRDTKVKSSFCSWKGYLGTLTSPVGVGAKGQCQMGPGHAWGQD